MPFVQAHARTITLRYFASVREGIGTGSEEITLTPEIATVADLVDWLRSREPAYAAALAESVKIRVAVDHVHAQPETSIREASEIALFPMMTGG